MDNNFLKRVGDIIHNIIIIIIMQIYIHNTIINVLCMYMYAQIAYMYMHNILYTHTYIVMYYNMYIYLYMHFNVPKIDIIIIILVKYYGLSENCSIGCLPSIEEI